MGRIVDSYSFRILITGGSSGLVETIADAVSIHSIKKAEYAKRLAQGQLGHVTLLDHFISVRSSALVLARGPNRSASSPMGTHPLQSSPGPSGISPSHSLVRVTILLKMCR